MFTILHELSHIHCHIHNQYNQRLLVSLNSEDYPTELKLLEDEANYVASILLFPNEVLINLISRGYTYREILLEGKVSSTAIFNRLRNMLLYSMKLSKNTVYMLLKKYRESNDTTLNAVMSKIRDYFERNNYL
ncbi:ImmA/IrrE family metallo-endopeptidase [Gemella sp.]